MEWHQVLLLIFFMLLFLMALGMPVAFCFMTVNVIGAFLFMGGTKGMEQLGFSLYESVSRFNLIALPLFILMGEIMFQSQMAGKMIDTVDKWLGRLPGRLGVEAVAAGTIFATLTGSSSGSVAMLGSTLLPEMGKRGYKKFMSLGPILGSGGLAMMIPPSGLAVLMGALGEISIGGILVAIVVPGFLMAVLYASYIILTCKFKPELAPSYDVTIPKLSDRLLNTAKYILPLAFIIFLVVGVIFLGVATPSEAAALGVVGNIILAIAYSRFTWKMAKKSVSKSLEITVMIFMIITGAQAFSQMLAFTGASSGLVQLVLGFSVPPIVVLVLMQVLVLILGMLLDSASILMITVPLFMPIVHALGFNDIWFAVIMLINIEVGLISPPFGMSLFVMKGVAAADTTMKDVYAASIPYCFMDIVAMALIISVPPIALWLPGLMSTS